MKLETLLLLSLLALLLPLLLSFLFILILAFFLCHPALLFSQVLDDPSGFKH